MLQFYLSSVLIWFIIIFSEILICTTVVYKNGWFDEFKNKKPSVIRFIANIISYMAAAAIPIFRFLIAIIIFVMAAIPKKRLNEMIEDIKNAKMNNDNSEE